MTKKYNEKMIVHSGKMVYAISLEDKNNMNDDRTHILIDNGKVYFSNTWYSNTREFNFNDEAHKIAKEIFVSQLQVDIKRRILELKQLEEIFESVGLKECLGNSIYDNSQKILEMKKEIKKDLRKDIKNIETKIEEKTIEAIEDNVKSIARKKKKNQ
ncbi:MAG: hypothetical protein IJO32_00460 [Bacilli bacterium]|nr:hypothetical protein [Bacilli bacterium]